MEGVNTYQITNKAGTAFIRIIGEISFWKNSSEKFTNAIDALINAGIEDVELYMNSAGGSMFEANEIAIQISRFKGKKTVTLGAIVASAASYLMTYFDKVTAASNTQIMLHDPIQVLKVEHLGDFDSSKKLYENLQNIAIDSYSQKMGLDKEQVSEMMRVTTWLSAKEAKAKGLVDEISSGKEKLPENTAKILTKMNLDTIPETITMEIQNNNSKFQNNNDMKEIIKALGLPKGTTEEQAINAINNLKNTAVKAVTELATSKGLKTESIVKLAGTDIENTLKMVLETEIKSVEDTATVNTVVQTIENALKGSKPPKEKSLDEYTPTELEMMAEEVPEKYENLIKKTYQ